MLMDTKVVAVDQSHSARQTTKLAHEQCCVFQFLLCFSKPLLLKGKAKTKSFNHKKRLLKSLPISIMLNPISIIKLYNAEHSWDISRVRN